MTTQSSGAAAADPLDILYLADIRFPLERANGIQTFETCHALARRGHRVTLLVRDDSARPRRDAFEFYGRPPIPTLRIMRLSMAGPYTLRRVRYVAAAMWSAVGANRLGCVLTRDLGVADSVLSLPGRLRPPLVYESHGYAPAVSRNLPSMLSDGVPPSSVKSRRLARRERRVWQRADAYATITAGLRDELVQRFGHRDRVVVIPDGARLPDALPALPAWADAGRPPVVGYAGHLYPWKGVDVLVRTLERLPGVHGLIIGGLAGDPDLARLQALANTRVPGRLTFAGHVAPGLVAERLRAADVLVIPNPPGQISAAYTSPLKLFEYMGSGRPVVASDLPALREILVDGDNALLVEAGNADALGAALRRVLDDRALATRLAARAFETVQAYSWDGRAERLETLLRQVFRADGLLKDDE
jgi:glycosyltransferase involved in cell wall biosynthesis